MVTRKHLSVTFTNIFKPSYEVCTVETSSRFLQGDGKTAAGNNNHSHLDCSHTDAQAGLCSLQRIARTDSLTTVCGNISINAKMKIFHINESGMNEYIRYMNKPILRYSVAPDICGSHGYGQGSATECCLQRIHPPVRIELKYSAYSPVLKRK
jgi:hypothetical protein